MDLLQGQTRLACPHANLTIGKTNFRFFDGALIARHKLQPSRKEGQGSDA